MDWSKDAFEKARRENKPILLDIGASWCHWCHVMERTTYSDPEVVDLIEDQFVPIQIDTDARPEINSRYNRGGWPTTAFLTPDGNLMGGATFIPPAQMKRTMLEYSRFYAENKQEIHEKFIESHEARDEELEEIDEACLDARVVEQAAQDIKRHADFQNGGFGRAPKFPHPEPIALALLRYHTHRDPEMLDFAKVTLDSMAAGGIRDHIGGGFHRYAVDANWRVPHFEKMLDVNATILSSYIAGYRALKDETYREAAEGIMCFLEGVLPAPEGCFYSAQDADAHEGDDGGFFTWTVAEVQNALAKPTARAVIDYYGMTSAGNVESTPGRNVFYQAMSLEWLARKLDVSTQEAQASLNEAKATLAEVRSRRPAPKVDRKIITSWNCLAAEAYFDAYEAFENQEHLRRALGIVDFLIQNAVAPDGGACHYIENGEAHVHGLLADQAALINTCLDAYEITGNRGYLNHAQSLAGFVNERLAAPSGGYFDRTPTPEDCGELAIRAKTIYDNAETARALARLYLLTGEINYQDDARIALASLLPEFEKMGYLAAGYALAADLFVNYPVELVTVGPRDAAETLALHEAGLKLYEPRRIVQLLDPATDGDLMAKKGYVAQEKPTLFMCVNNTCAPPIHTPEQLQEAYEHFATEAATVQG